MVIATLSDGPLQLGLGLNVQHELFFLIYDFYVQAQVLDGVL